MSLEEPVKARFSLRRWPVALGAAGLGLAALAASLWFFRIPIIELGLRGALAERNVDADFRVQRMDFSGLTLINLRLGAEDAPDATAAAANVAFTWRGLSPAIRAVSLIDPRVRVRVDQEGHVSAGQLSNLSQGGAAQRARIPAIGLDISGGQALVEGPFGALPIAFESSGVIGRDFVASARLDSATLPGAEYALERAQAELTLASNAEDSGALKFQLSAGAAQVRWGAFSLSNGGLRANGQTALDLGAMRAHVELNAAQLGWAQTIATDLHASIDGETAFVGTGDTPGVWSGAAQARAGRAISRGERSELARLDRAQFAGAWRGEGDAGDGEFTLTGAGFSSLGLISDAPSAAGQFRLDLGQDEKMRAGAQLLLERSRLSASAQADLRSALPDVASLPPGPLLAALERALDAGADNFALSAPVQLRWNSAGLRLVAAQPTEVRARSGAVLRIAPLRADAPGLVMQWPGARLHGAIAIETSGGGLPDAALLFDAVDWAPGAPLEADGTLTVEDWRSIDAAASIGDMRVALVLPAEGGGRLDLNGAARLSGPMGAGRVRNLGADLDVVVAWDRGWRVSPKNACIPIRIAEADAPGLSFYGGVMRACAADGALMAVDAAGNLSGGFVIDNLSLNGRVASAEAQPAQMRARSVRGRFLGTLSEFGLALDAGQPALAVDFSPERRLELTGASVTAELRSADGDWSIGGGFTDGVLNDPALPGEVSAIGGRWRAAPENGDTVVRVSAGEALVVAREGLVPGDTRPLFNPMRVTGASAEMRGERITAQGGIVLEAGARGVARFVAEHDIGDGAGAMRIEAEALVFSEDLQPFELSELARGVVENVNGRAVASADIRWQASNVTATGLLRLQDMAMATATIPVIEHVSGDIVFDDLFALTTPPGQRVSVGLINPGVAVRDGSLQFQLLNDKRVSIERAEFNFASGVLAVAPTVITLGAAETELELTLRDVDVATLITQLNVPDLTATGRVEGSFPLTLGPEVAKIRGGVLRAAPGGGEIAYTGHAGDAATGPAAMAFQALTSFRYDNLALHVDGDLFGELITQIQFSGENTNRSVDLGAGVGGVESVRVSGVPFRFNVSITAPFRGLSETVASVTDPGAIRDQYQRQQEREAESRERAAEEGVDPAPPAQR